MKTLIPILVLAAWLFLVPDQGKSSPYGQQQYKEKLSDYGLFEGPLAQMKAKATVMEYEMNTPLFSDYAHKRRYIALPEGQKITFKSDREFSFPVGTVMLKTFFYPADFRKPEEQRRILETRVLVLEESGWTALNYVWNEEQTEAFLDFSLHVLPMKWTDEQGRSRQVEYNIPSLSNCKTCHLRGKEVLPLGPTVAQLNGQLKNGQNQLESFVAKGFLAALPKPVAELPAMAHWNDPKLSLESRARAWLDANCAHCHHKQGIAGVSGLYLDAEEQNPIARGIRKKPVSRAFVQGVYQHDIEPGKPEASILVYRIENHDPNVRMPRIASQMVHDEGLDLVKAWIKAME